MTAAPTEPDPLFTLTPDEALASVGGEARSGLSSEEATARLERYGPNSFTQAKADPAWLRFLRQYRDPMQLVLLIAGIVSIVVVGTLSTGVLLLVLTLFNALMSLSQEGKATAAVSALQEMMIVTTRVTRGDELIERATSSLPTAGC